MTRSGLRTRSKHAPRAFAGIAGAVALVCSFAAPASAAPGQIDATFGHLGNGTVLTDHGKGDFPVKLLRQPDGRLVTVANLAGADGTQSIDVTRYLANGAVDASFGNAGRFTEATIGSGTVTDAVLQPDGKIVVVGFTQTTLGFFVIRLRANGTLDPAFVTAHPTTNFSGSSVDMASGVALGPAGTIVVAGRSDTNVAIARYTSTGALDPTFSGDGLVTHDFGSPTDVGDVAVQADGRIVVVGDGTGPNRTADALVARFNTNGTLDTTYGTGGRVATAGAPVVFAVRVLLQGTKAIVAGIGPTGVSPFNAIARYNANGTLDTTFGSHGSTIAQVGKFTRISDMALDGSGRLVAIGQAAYSDDFPDVTWFTALFRYSANGVTDPLFGCFGSVLTETLGNGAGAAYNSSQAASGVVDGNDIIIGGAAETFNGTDFSPTDTLLARYDGDGPHTSGYALLRDDGGISAFGGAPACGSMAGLALNRPIVGTAFDPIAPGNWTVASDGGVFTFGAARFLGSTGAIHLNQPIVGMASTRDGKGYWLVARDGGIFAFGDAGFFGSTGAIHLNQPIVGMAAARDGKGYWLVASDGGIFAFGSARFAGSTGAMHLNQPVVGMAADVDGTGYWLVASDGGVFSFGARFAGSTGAIRLNQPIVGMAADPDGSGYWMGARDGGVFAFSAKFSGSTGATPFPVGSVRSTIGIAATP